MGILTLKDVVNEVMYCSWSERNYYDDNCMIAGMDLSIKKTIINHQAVLYFPTRA
jgi:hypothetical protein